MPPKSKGRGRGSLRGIACGRAGRSSPSRSSGSCNLLANAAEAVVASLCSGLSLNAKESWAASLHSVKDAFLAENADESPEAAKRCAALRAGFAAAVRKALSTTPTAASLVPADRLSPKVRVEVRGTAGRMVEGTSFVVGRGPESDVQAYGDATVSRLQLIVVSLPNAVLVIDAFSGSGTRTVQRLATEATGRPTSTPGHRAPFVLAHNERAVLQLGQKTTIALGLSEKAASDAVSKAAKGLISLAGELTPPPTLSFAPTLMVDAPSLSVATTLPDAPEIVRELRPNPPPATSVSDVPELVGEVRSAPTPAKDSRSADIGRQEELIESLRDTPLSQFLDIDGQKAENGDRSSSGIVPTPVRAHVVGNGASSSSKPEVVRKRTLDVARVAEKIRSVPARRSQLIWRCRAGARCGVLSDEQCSRLEERVMNSQHDLDDVSEILDGLGIPAAPKEPYRAASGTLLATGMRVCINGLTGSPELNGSTGSCAKWQSMRGRWVVKLENGKEIAVRPENLSSAPEEKATILPEGLGADFAVLKCADASCHETLTVSKADARTRFQCVCGAPSMCTGCGTSPYHYHGQCADIPKLRERWHDWLKGRGRNAYRGLRQKAQREATAQRRALQEASHAAGVMLPAEAKRHNLLAARAKFIKGEGVRHFFTRCSLCDSAGSCIVGPRFQCLHCPAYDVCLKCEPRLAAEHAEDHVFQIHFECEFDWGKAGVELPVGTHARLRQHPVEAEGPAYSEAASSARGQKRKRGYGLEGVIRGFKRGKYDVELLDSGAMRHVLPQDLQPLLTQHEARKLLDGSCSNGTETA